MNRLEIVRKLSDIGQKAGIKYYEKSGRLHLVFSQNPTTLDCPFSNMSCFKYEQDKKS